MNFFYISPDADVRPSPGTADAGRWRTDAVSYHGIITMNEVLLLSQNIIASCNVKFETHTYAAYVSNVVHVANKL